MAASYSELYEEGEADHINVFGLNSIAQQLDLSLVRMRRTPFNALQGSL